MPYNSVADLPANVKAKPAKTQRQWMHVWNSAFQACMAKDEGGTSSCETEAFAKANGVIKGGEMPDDDKAVRRFHSGIVLLEKNNSKANYREAADDSSEHCGNCRFYEQWSRSCSLVEGTIEPSYVSNLWEELLPSQRPIGALVSDAGVYSERALQVFVGFSETDFSKPAWIPYLPKPGKYQHASYGEVEITKESNEEIVDSIKNKIYQEKIPLDAEHQSKLSGAVGWISDARVNDDGTADAYVEWTTRGQTLLKDGAFKYISPEWFPAWREPASGTVYNNVAAGGAITTRPFFKEKVLRALVASEVGMDLVYKEDPTVGDENKDKTPAPAPAPTPNPEPTPQPTGDPKTATFAEIVETPEAKAFIEAKIAEAVKAKDDEAKTFAEQLKTQIAANTTLAGRLDSIEQADRTRRFSDLVAGRGANDGAAPWAGEADANVKFLEELSAKFGEDSDTFKSFVTQQAAIAAQLKASSLFTEVGSAGSGSSFKMTDPESRLDQMAKDLQKADPSKDYSVAYSEALKSDEGRRLYGEIDAARPR